ncbi:Trehalose-6-Phosphate Synthase [Zostera marina]|uniref:alpha,alpha-trehalose-phosphate synthase (UDP-forming) n=1 Tax=Zostera marina TaxID=29655 RepID=A0A0K9PF86_ZOSMR|nr:Trehalose-6-Phosphate Synthase [Zostera marina]
MMSRSYTNLQDLATGNLPVIGGGRSRSNRLFQRVMTVPGNIFELDDDATDSPSSETPSSIIQERIIIVGNNLPIRAIRRPDNCGWSFSWDSESLLLQMKDGLPDDIEVIYVGILCDADVDVSEQDEVSQILLEKFKCVPAFLPTKVFDEFYNGFCKQQIWPLFHYMLPYTPDQGRRFDKSLWQAYVAANNIFSQKVIEVINPEDDFVWIHDYHLMVLPTFLRRRFNRLRMGFFLHSPFPSSEIYRALPVRDEILKALLNSDLIGFHTFDYARHFLSCCSRMLGLEYESKRGYIGLEYFGRTVGIKIMPTGIHMGQLRSVIQLADKQCKIKELRHKFMGKTVLLGVDDLDIFKGINLKLLAFEQMLKMRPSWQGKAVLVQIANAVSGGGKDLDGLQKEIKESRDRIKEQFGSDDYEPVVYIDRVVSIEERIAYYTIAECVIVTAVRDGLNLTPYEYIVSRQGLGLDHDSDPDPPRHSMLVVSEFVGCSPSLSGAIRINPWNIESTAEALNDAISMIDAEKHLRHEKHYRYVSTHDVAYWSRSFVLDMERTCRDHFRKKCWGIGLGFGFRVVALDPNFRKLNIEEILSAYQKAKNRAVLLDYDGTLVPHTTMNKIPSKEVISIMNSLSRDEKNMIFLVSGRGRDSLSKWFSPCKNMGIAAEHGYFMRWSSKEEWRICGPGEVFGWRQMAEPVMKLYTEATDGSSIEKKESALVWRYQDADPDFGSSQATEMLDHLENVLANEPVEVKKGQFIVEVKPQGVSKGLVAEKILSTMAKKTRADFILCIGDDRSDEDMFEGIGTIRSDMLSTDSKVFACTVGQKPSKAKYYLNDTREVLTTLKVLAEFSDKS